jgi:PKD repeat protein
MSRGVLMRTPGTRPQYQRDRSLGQSLTEFALFLPVLLLLVLVALDFGRVYLGWINLQQMARVAAGFAADNALDWPADQDRYEERLRAESTLINCEPDETTWLPQYGSDISLGQHVTVKIDCEFDLVTPIISQILGTSITASASTTYPIRDGIVGSIPGGGGPTTPAPEANFTASPTAGWAPLTVTFTDTSTNAPASWDWNFSAGVATGTSPTATPATANTAGPHTVVYDCGGAEGETCVFNVELTAINSGGSDTEVRDALITVTVPPATGPLADFTATPLTGNEPLTVDFTMTDLRGTAVSWVWDFGDGTVLPPGTDLTPQHEYAEGDWTVTLTVTDVDGLSNPTTKVLYIHVEHRICTVPDFQNTWAYPHISGDPGAQARWADNDFTTTVTILPDRQGGTTENYKIRSQTLTGGTIDPQPLGCDSTITVGPGGAQ